jgi:aquaporin Z
MKKYLAEFIGTYGLVFCGTGAMTINEVTNGAVSHVGVAITFGLIVTAMIYAFGSISGAHINPAVSIGFTLTKTLKAKDLIPYILAQLLGALAASFTLKFLFPTSLKLGATLPLGSWQQSFVLEIILTYFLMVGILFVSQNKKTTAYTGLVVGGIVLLEAMFAGPITGASMNPARSIAPALLSGNLDHMFIYILAPVLGAILATYTWIFMKEESTEEENH